MTDRAKRMTVIWTLILVPLLPFIVAAGKALWDTKEDASHHEADMQEIRTLQQRTLDVVCVGKEQLRQCSSP